MKRSTAMWILAFIVTAGTGVFQRLTGPTYPLSGNVTFLGTALHYSFDRSHGGDSEARVTVPIEDPEVHATLLWRPFQSEDAWREVQMEFSDGALRGALPVQPPLTKLEYRVHLEKNESSVLFPDQPVAIRYKGNVPVWVLLPHVLAMFGAMLFSLRAGLEYFSPEPAYQKLAMWTIALLVVGGFIFGPLMSYYAFNLLWTGWPVGMDITDNKTAIALVGWIIGVVGMKRTKSPGLWVIGAAVVMFVVFLIPHSV